MKLFALAAATWGIAGIVHDAVQSYDRFDSASLQPSALRSSAFVAIILLSAPPLAPNGSVSTLLHRTCATIAVSVSALAGLQRGTNGARAADALYTTLSLLCAFWASTWQDELGQAQRVERRTFTVERRTAAMFSAATSFYTSLRIAKRSAEAAKTAIAFSIQTPDGTIALGSGFSQPYAAVTAAGAAFTAAASLSVILSNGDRQSALVLSMSLVVQLIVAFSDALAFTEVLSAFPSIVNVPSLVMTESQSRTVGVAATSSSSGPSLVLAIAQLLLYRAIVHGVNAQSDNTENKKLKILGRPLKRTTYREVDDRLSAAWISVAVPLGVIASVALVLAWTANLAQQNLWVEGAVVAFAACSVLHLTFPIYVGEIASGTVGLVYIVVYAAVVKNAEVHAHPTYWLFCGCMITQLVCGIADAFATATQSNRMRSAAAACAFASVSCAMLLYAGWALLCSVVPGRAVVASLRGMDLVAGRYVVTLVISHDIPPLVVLPSLWTRKRTNSPVVAMAWYVGSPVAMVMGYLLVAAAVGVAEVSATNVVFGDDGVTMVTMCAAFGAVIVPWLSIGVAFAFEDEVYF